MFRQTRQYHPLRLNTLLYGKTTLSDNDMYGKTTLSDNDNYFLFQTVQQYIKDSGRF